MIELEKVYIDGVYKGKVVVEEDELTPEFIRQIKEDSEDVMGWRKYHGVLDNKIRNRWRAVKIE